MTLLRHSDRNPDPKWESLSAERIAAWRNKVKQNVLNTEGRRVEAGIITTAHHAGWDRAETDHAGNPVVDQPTPEDPRTGRETVEIMAKAMADQMIVWSARDPGRYMERIQLMKQQGGLGHLTDEEAAAQVLSLCRKVAEMEVQQVYESLDLMRKA